MEKNTNLTVWVVGALLIGILLTVLALPSKEVPVASQCPVVNIPACPVPNVSVSDTDNGWKQEAVSLATAEWSEKGYKPLFLEINNIDKKEDISKVVVISSKVTDSDSFSKDAEVTQEVRVYYENNHGDSKRENLVIKTSIVDGEVDHSSIH